MKKIDPRDLSLGHLLAHVCRLLSGQRGMRMESIGIYHAQGMILFWLWKKDGMSQRSLAREVHISPPTASNTLKRMERDGLIERRRDENDQRIVRVYLTEKSRQLQVEASNLFKEMDAETISVLDKEEQKSFQSHLIKIHDHLVSMYEANNDCMGVMKHGAPKQ